MIISAISAALSLIAYPLFEHIADIERGYDSSVFGGEELALIFGLLIIPALVIFGENRRPAMERSKTDSGDAEVV